MANVSQRFLMIYSGVLTLAFGAIVLTGAANTRSVKFDQVDVQRINIREADGTLRMVISNKDQFPGAIIKNNEYPHPRGVAGLLFFNDEGSENGGLVFAGHRGADGKVSSGGSLTFDRYEQDQIVQLVGSEDAGEQYAGLVVSDRPDRSVARDFEEKAQLDAMPETEREKLMAARYQEGYYGQSRVFIGKNGERDSVLNLKDAAGNTRLRLKVAPEGAATIEFLDAAGKVQHALTPESLAR